MISFLHEFYAREGKIAYVPAHKGIIRNEKADIAAKKAHLSKKLENLFIDYSIPIKEAQSKFL